MLSLLDKTYITRAGATSPKRQHHVLFMYCTDIIKARQEFIATTVAKMGAIEV